MVKNFEPLKHQIEILLGKSGRSTTFTAEQSLFVSGLLDSISAMELVNFLEANFASEMEDLISISQLDSLDKITEFLAVARSQI